MVKYSLNIHNLPIASSLATSSDSDKLESVVWVGEYTVDTWEYATGLVSNGTAGADSGVGVKSASMGYKGGISLVILVKILPFAKWHTIYRNGRLIIHHKVT